MNFLKNLISSQNSHVSSKKRELATQKNKYLKVLSFLLALAFIASTSTPWLTFAAPKVKVQRPSEQEDVSNQDTTDESSGTQDEAATTPDEITSTEAADGAASIVDSTSSQPSQDSLPDIITPDDKKEAVADCGDIPAEICKEVQEIKARLEIVDNKILYTKLKMLAYKYSGLEAEKSLYDFSSFSLRGFSIVQEVSPLIHDLYGGFINRQNNDLRQGIDLLTGQKAIDETLQLESIGAERNDPNSNLLQDVTRSIEMYKEDFQKYPVSLEDFQELETMKFYKDVRYGGTRVNIADLADKFNYFLNDETFTLTLKNEKSSYILDDIKPLGIASHPWDEMTAKLESKTEPPQIFKFVPEDHFAVYFDDMKKFDQLEETLKNFTSSLDIIFSIGEVANLKEKILRKLDIQKFDKLQGLVEEFIFVSSDLDFYPGTSFALVLKLKSELAQSLLDILNSDKNFHEKIGDYYVIATHSQILEEIKNAQSGKKKSMLDAKDFHYAWNVLEKRRDGIVYFSENFIRKLVGPKHRTNAARRNTIIKSLETLQYTVFAYQNIEKKWPASIQEIADSGYIDIAKIKNPEDFTVDKAGKVRHKIWGSLYDIAPVENIDLKDITSAEKNIYEQFVVGYQSFWREFFDPIGVGISIGDQIMLHTVILPLIDESEYNEMKDFIGGDPINFELLENPQRIPAVELHSKLNIEEIFYKIGREVEYSEYREKARKEEIPYDQQKTEDEYLEQLSRDEIIKKTQKKWFEFIGWKEDTKIMDVFGQEVMLGIGEKNRFTINNIANLDIYLGIHLKDSETAQKLIEASMKSVADAFGKNLRPPIPGLGFFDIALEPVRNEYNGTEFFLIPMGFVNLMYAFVNGNLYLGISQVAINNLIDGPQKMEESGGYSQSAKRGLDYVGRNHNILLSADIKRIKSWKEDVKVDSLDPRIAGMFFTPLRNYLDEAVTLAKSLPDYDDKLSNVDGIYYRNIPDKWMLADLYVENGVKKMKYGENEYEMNVIKTSNSNSYFMGLSDKKEESEEKNVNLEDIMKTFDINEILTTWDFMENLTLGFNFTKEGISTKLAFKNNASDTLDERFLEAEEKGLWEKYKWIAIGSAAGLIVLIIVIIVIAKIIHRKREYDETISDSDQSEPPVDATPPFVSNMESPESISKTRFAAAEAEPPLRARAVRSHETPLKPPSPPVMPSGTNLP